MAYFEIDVGERSRVPHGAVRQSSTKKAEGLERPTYPGDLGKRIYLNISQEAWQMWVGHQTMLINEYRLTPVDPKAR